MNEYSIGLRRVWLGLVLSIVTTIYGFVGGAVLGLEDGAIRGALAARVPEASRGERDALVDRSWTFLRRSHLHASGMGTAAIALISLVPVIAARQPRWLGAGMSLGMGAGGAGYAAALIVAAVRTPPLASAALAKESAKLIAIPAAGAYMGGAALLLCLTIVWAW
ncbi:MAG: hypothetical protein JNL50_02785, partial [Phycisphaerae bacterium]|nr:hypothetical protein [Phycisphaerae bacterium]